MKNNKSQLFIVDKIVKGKNNIMEAIFEDNKIHTLFVISDKGEIVDVKMQTTYKALVIEAMRVLKKLPKFKPDIQNSSTVKVRCNLSIAFGLE
ncbi:hypothetical protein MPF19_02385 [Polaribacter sp. Z014]|uniref:hypothetical protein n=1 Tax=Polaribacter sp. Z014 TaxID=2927126 RepID=UPI0020212549|nr:hypothetical protein [Polaribacter sp. Z014]MCL7762248.1 hypothetical protein [Polaribacter sp. Z014]